MVFFNESEIFIMIRNLHLFLLAGLFLARAGYSGTVLISRDTISTDRQELPVEKSEPFHRNVIKFNPTPMLLWSNVRNITLSYERLIKNDMSLCIQAGYLIFPKIISDTIAGLITISEGNKHGVNLAFDYRYYPGARNRRPAPDGLYLGGYLSYYGFRFNNPLDILESDADQNGELNGSLNILNLGVNVGYQFIFWKRFSVDLLMFGPSMSVYHGRLGLEGNFDPGEIEEIDEELVNALLEQFPWLSVLFTQQKLEFTGSKTKLSAGLRFSIQLGFHF
jgi:hypothetical protein